MKNNYLFSAIAVGTGIYISLCALSVISAFFWIKSLLAPLPNTNISKQQVAISFARFIEKEKKVSSHLLQFSTVKKAITLKESETESTDFLLNVFLDEERNHELSTFVIHCLGDETDTKILGFIVANKRQVDRLDSDMLLSQSSLENMKKNAEAYKKKIKLVLQVLDDNETCGHEKYLLSNLARAL